MNLFDSLVNEALKNQPHLSALRIVVEKELLHHDILRILSESDLLSELTFIGGTALRSCYGGIRLSEDLDFTGGGDFSRDSLKEMGEILTTNINKKYGLKVIVSDPVKDIKNVDTWKIKIQTRPQRKNIPLQRINIDICAVPSYDKKPMLLINNYRVDMGTNGLIIQTQSQEEIYVDKLLAFALRPNRIKHRDLWDIVWLHQQGVKPKLNLVPYKLRDRRLNSDNFIELFNKRASLLSKDSNLQLEFSKEMQRFLPQQKVNDALEKNGFWDFIIYLINDLEKKMLVELDSKA